MTAERRNDLLQRFKVNAPATSFEIDALEDEAKTSLPGEYRDFLYVTDGGYGIVGSTGYVMLWRVNELLRFNREYEVAEYAPGLLLFGSNGGGEGFAFDLRIPNKPIVSVPFIGMDMADVKPIADTFDGFMEHLAQL